MKKKQNLFVGLVAALLLSSCSQEELGEQGMALPEGEYPLQIGSVSITAEASEEPWTRVTEKPDGSGSEWEWDGMEKFAVRLGDETAVYTLNPDHTMTADRQLYWKSTAPATVTAWYPATDGALYLGGQDNGLVYVLRAAADNANHNTPVNLQFEHQLAKVRVIVKGTADVIDVEPMNVPISCDVKEGEIVNIGIMQLNYPMFKTTYEDIGPCWEINLPPSPDYRIENFMIFTSDPIDIQCDITPSITLEAGKVHTFTLTVHRKDTKTIDLSNGDYTINGDGTYYFSGTASHAIRVTGGQPNIYLEDATISVSSGPAIDITGGNPTIHVRGENTVENTQQHINGGAGIYVAEGSSVTIQGRDRNDVLTARAGVDGAGNGGYGVNSAGYNPCGNITISHVTVYAYGNSYMTSSPGIGSRKSCGAIRISDATVHATGLTDCPAIGSYTSVPTIVISGSDIYAHRGTFYDGISYADWIGRGGVPYEEYQGGAIQGTITSTTVYKGRWDGGGEVPEGTVVYDAGGNATEQP